MAPGLLDSRFMRWAALALVTVVAFGPSNAEARRYQAKSKRDAAATLARWRAKAAKPAKNARCTQCTRFGLSLARALVSEQQPSPTGDKISPAGIYSGRDPATRALKVVRLQQVSQNGDTYRIRTIEVDGEADRAAVERNFVLQPKASNDRTPGDLYRSSDGATIRMLRGRGFVDYHDPTFEGIPERGTSKRSNRPAN